MKAIKIDISKKWVDVFHGVYREAIREQVMVAFQETGKTPDVINMKEVIYFPIKVYGPGNFEFTTYLVKQDDEKIFKDLLAIQQSTLDKAVRFKVDELWERNYMEINANACNRIRKLPWYKRLLKQF